MDITTTEEGTQRYGFVSGEKRICTAKTAAKIRCYQEDLCNQQSISNPQRTRTSQRPARFRFGLPSHYSISIYRSSRSSSPLLQTYRFPRILQEDDRPRHADIFQITIPLPSSRTLQRHHPPRHQTHKFPLRARQAARRPRRLWLGGTRRYRRKALSVSGIRLRPPPPHNQLRNRNSRPL